MTEETKDAEELLQQSKEQNRHTSEPTASSPEDDSTVDHVTAIKEALQEIEDGTIPENINIRDARLKGLLVGLERAGDLEETARKVATYTDTDIDRTPTQSMLARLLIRAGLQEVLPEVLDDAKEARKQQMIEQADDF